MSEKNSRDLTSLEYVVIGLIGMEPQSGYSIVSYFDEGMYSWSASPGSIYPILKRLEKQGIITGQLEMEYETRPRKVYTLTSLGEKLLDDWLREVPKVRPFYEQREMALLRFQFMESRLKLPEVIQWLENYLDVIRVTDAHRQVVHAGVLAAMDEYGLGSVHKQLVLEATIMEINAMRTWLEMSIARLRAIAIQTGEFKSISPGSGQF